MNDICPYHNQPALSLGEGLALVVSRARGTGPVLRAKAVSAQKNALLVF